MEILIKVIQSSLSNEKWILRNGLMQYDGGGSSRGIKAHSVLTGWI